MVGARWGLAARSPLLPLAGVALPALAIRMNNALRYPPDWGFDASFNWRYIYRLSQDWQLPDPSAGWSTADPPLFFAAAAALMSGLSAVGATGLAVLAIPLLSALAGLGVVALAYAFVRRVDRNDPRRAWLAAALLLFLPAHVQMSAMVNEEMLAALFVSLVLYALAVDRASTRDADGWRRTAGIGAAAGLALLTKLTGAVAVATAAATLALDAWRRRDARSGARRLCVLLVAALLFGGWFFARNLLAFGTPLPFGLPAHQAMFDMPPGERGIGDYLRLPAATFLDPQLLQPELLRSVWGSTYATLWFDGHRYFLPRDDPEVRRLGTLTLGLALLPTAAFALGVFRGVRRSRESAASPDLPLLLALVFGLVGYALYTWRNPWFSVVKGTSLLSLSLPFAFYTSESLARWTRGPRLLAISTWILLALLALAVAATSSFDVLFEKREVSGLDWAAGISP